MADAPRKFQAPKGTRDFYPADLAVRRHIENVWRQTSINHGFDEIDGPTFEHLDLYTHKSGPGIASELFQVFSGKDEELVAAMRSGVAAPYVSAMVPVQVAGMKSAAAVAPYALRPEFTPTLARLVAARAPELPRPIKWFAIPSHFRAESPQRGRLREFMQWNVDFVDKHASAVSRARADAEVIAVCIEALRDLGLTEKSFKIHINDRNFARGILEQIGIQNEHYDLMFQLIDQQTKRSPSEIAYVLGAEGLPADSMERFEIVARDLVREMNADTPEEAVDLYNEGAKNLRNVLRALRETGLGQWCEIDHTIVRGLAYYTGTVFEALETSGAERAIAGGGRYDNLIESFGGPELGACGFGMGDVVLANILKDKGLLKPAEEYLPRPDAFVIAASDEAAARVPGIVAELRRGNLHVRNSYKTTRNVGKLLGDAGKCRARYAVILGSELAEQPPRVALKNLESGEQETIALADLAGRLRGTDAAD